MNIVFMENVAMKPSLKHKHVPGTNIYGKYLDFRISNFLHDCARKWEVRISLSRSQEHRPFWVEICQIWNRCYCLQEAGRRGGAGVGCSEQLNTVSSAATHQYRGLTVWPDTHGHTGTRDSYDQEEPCVKIVKRAMFRYFLSVALSSLKYLKGSR